MHIETALAAARAPQSEPLHDDPPPGPFWVFAYGSLIWDPGFPFTDRRVATLHGFHRRFCIASTRYRGTAESPGLVLGLDRGGSCQGVAMRVAAEHAATTLAYLDAREIPDPVYRRRLLPARFRCGTKLPALVYVARRDWPGYCRLPPERMAAVIARAHGSRGSNREYLVRTLHGLSEAGVADPALLRLAAQLQRIESAPAATT